MRTEEPFSKQLDDWLESAKPKTLGGLGEVFEEKSFAVGVLLLMFTQASATRGYEVRYGARNSISAASSSSGACSATQWAAPARTTP